MMYKYRDMLINNITGKRWQVIDEVDDGLVLLDDDEKMNIITFSEESEYTLA